MKLTEEQLREVRSKFLQLALRGTTTEKDLEDLLIWVSETFPQSTEGPNTTRWYHCSERLPTVEEGDAAGDVFRFNPDNNCASYSHYVPLTRDMNIWWTPKPKNLVKPTPPDPFEELWKGATVSFGPFLSVFLENYVKNAMKKAYELGLSQPKQ